MSPDKQAEPKPTVTKDSSEFNKDAYASIPPGELVVFAVQVLQADGSPAASEDVVSICFRFFPHSFALKNYFYWPDSALVTRRLHDAKEKGLLKGSAVDGFEVKVQGRQVAKHVAKALGVVFPVPPKVEIPPAPVEEKKEEEKKETTPSAPVVKVVKKRAASKQVASKQATDNKKEPKKVKAGKKRAVKRPAAKPKVQAKPRKAVVTPVKKKPATKSRSQPKTASTRTVKPTERARVKKEERKKKAPKPAVKKVEKKQRTGKKETKAYAQSKQLTMPLPPPAAWKKAEVPAAEPRVRKEALPIGGRKPVKKEAAAPVLVSREEKVKAAKVVKQIERSDAYRSYRRSGRRAIIGEFDFRNMLFATMESSAETLNRNMDLFKRYAGIHFRADLIAFLDFCEEKFSALLVSKAKVKGRR